MKPKHSITLVWCCCGGLEKLLHKRGLVLIKDKNKDGLVSFHLLEVSVQFVDLRLEESLQLGPLGLQSRS